MDYRSLNNSRNMDNSQTLINDGKDHLDSLHPPNNNVTLGVGTSIP